MTSLRFDELTGSELVRFEADGYEPSFGEVKVVRRLRLCLRSKRWPEWALLCAQ
jgi:hypothetical protein